MRWRPLTALVLAGRRPVSCEPVVRTRGGPTEAVTASAAAYTSHKRSCSAIAVKRLLDSHGEHAQVARRVEEIGASLKTADGGASAQERMARLRKRVLERTSGSGAQAGSTRI